MADLKDAQKFANKSKDYLHHEGKEVLQKGAKELKESGKDWWCYVESHPIQSMIFGVVGYFALKGMFKN